MQEMDNINKMAFWKVLKYSKDSARILY